MKYSYHVHSKYSDGKSTINEVIQYAKEIGLDEIGISDHFHLSIDGLIMPTDMPVNELNEYVSEVLNYSSNIKPKVKLGLEAEFVPKTIDKLEKVISKYPFDYIIGSSHIVNNYVIDASIDKLPKDFTKDTIKQYWILIKQMAMSNVFDIVGHLDIPKKFGLKPTIDLTKEIDEALLAIKEADMTVEVNTSGWFQPCLEQYPAIDLLKKCKKLDIPIIVTADAHKVEHLTRGFDKAFELLKKNGYTKQAYFIKRKRFFTNFNL